MRLFATNENEAIDSPTSLQEAKMPLARIKTLRSSNSRPSAYEINALADCLQELKPC